MAHAKIVAQREEQNRFGKDVIRNLNLAMFFSCCFLHVAQLTVTTAITIDYGSPKKGDKFHDPIFPTPEDELQVFTSTISPKRYSFMVLLVDTTDPLGVLCGGSLITPRHVLTAGHCASTIKQLLNSSEAVEAWIGPLDRFDFEGPRILVKDIERHSDFKPKPVLHHDIAIVTLQEPVPLESQESLICIGTGDYDQHKATLIGFGNYDCFHDSSDLRIAHGTVVNTTNCKQAGHRGNLTELEQVCAVLYDTRGSRADQAQGDSGGPLFFDRREGSQCQYCHLSPHHPDTSFRAMINQDEIPCPYVQIGLVSYNYVIKGKRNSEGGYTNPCPNFNIPGTYTRVGEYHQFIKSIAPETKFWKPDP